MSLECRGEQRRARVREAGLNGLDYVEVSEDQLVLEVTFLEKAPDEIGLDNVRLDGGERITGIRIVDVRLCREDDPDLDDCMRVTVDRPGDFSPYTLCVVEPDPDGGPGREPLAGFDPRYACVEFSFKAGCDTGLDCAPADDCPPPRYDEPEISYLARDYESFRRAILDRLALVMPQWQERHAPDVVMAVVEALAYAGDQLAYYQDAVATEAYLDTARRRVSVRRHTRLVDYPMHDGGNARAWVCLEVGAELELPADDVLFLTVPGLPVAVAFPGIDPRLLAPPVFAPMAAGTISLRPAHNQIELWTWGNHECCLPVGTTRATLADPDQQLALGPGDVLIFEEIVGPVTGNPADADPAHRQAVRLTEATAGRDDLYDVTVLEVVWEQEDALRFPLCLSSIAGEDCHPVAPVSVARGNVVLVDHGRPIDFCGEGEGLTVPDPPPAPAACDCECIPSDPEPVSVAFRPALAGAPVTQAAPLPSDAVLARAQARIAAGLVDALTDWLRALLTRLRAGEALEDDELAQLRTIFGPAAVAAAGLGLQAPARAAAADPADALESLMGDEHELLTRKFQRTESLARRAWAGEVLGDDRVAELAALWGERFAGALRPSSAAAWGPAASALAHDPREALPAVRLLDADGGAWTPVRDLLSATGRDRVFVGEVDDDGVMWLRFGLPATAALPEPGSQLTASYRVGNGTAGNVAAEAIGRVALCETRTNAIVRVRNPLPAAGGVDPEPVSEVKLLAPGAFRRTLERAITADDYAQLAGALPGIQRAIARLRWTGSWYAADVGLDPLGTDQPDPRLLTAAADRLASYRRIGHDLEVARAEYVALDVELEVCVQAGFDPGHVRERLLAALGPSGLFAPDRLSFGSGIALSAVTAAAQAVPGVDSVRAVHFRRLFELDDSALDTGVLALGPLEIPQLDNDPSFPERGRLVLTMRGGG